jgi:hypothetical protein
MILRAGSGMTMRIRTRTRRIVHAGAELRI